MIFLKLLPMSLFFTFFLIGESNSSESFIGKDDFDENDKANKTMTEKAEYIIDSIGMGTKPTEIIRKINNTAKNGTEEIQKKTITT